MGVSGVGSADLNFGLAPAANANPTVSTAGFLPGMTTGVGLTPDMPGLTPNQGAMDSAFGSNPTADGLGWGDMKFMDKSQVVLGGLGSLAKIWSAFQANKIARESLDFQKQAFETNLGNQRASYNTAIEDRANSRASYAGTPEAQVRANEYIQKHSLGAS